MISAQQPYYRLPTSASSTALGNTGYASNARGQMLNTLRHSATTRSISMPPHEEELPVADGRAWRSRPEQPEHYAAAVAQQQQMLQYEMLKLQAYQQVQLQQQYFAQAQAQLAMMSLHNQQQHHARSQAQQQPSVFVAPDGSIQHVSQMHMGSVGQRTASPPARGDQAERGSPPLASTGRMTPAFAMTINGADSPTSTPSLSTSPQTPHNLVAAEDEPAAYPFDAEPQLAMYDSADHQLQIAAAQYHQQQAQFQQKLFMLPTQQPAVPVSARASTRPPRQPTPVAAAGTTLSFPVRQPRGPATLEVKDLGELNFAARARRQLGTRLSDLRELAEQRQGSARAVYA